jgi:hypothetical protein
VVHGDDGRGSAGGRPFLVGLLGGTLVHEFPVDGREDSLLTVPEARVGLGRLATVITGFGAGSSSGGSRDSGQGCWGRAGGLAPGPQAAQASEPTGR